MEKSLSGYQKDARRALLLGLIAVSLFVFLRPIKTENFQVKQFRVGIKIKIPKSSPPLAILQDEKIVPLLVEPAEPLTTTSKQIVISASRGMLRDEIFKNTQNKSNLFSLRQPIEFKGKGLVISKAEYGNPAINSGNQMVIANHERANKVENSYSLANNSRNLSGLNFYQNKNTEEIVARAFPTERQKFIQGLPTNLRARAEKIEKLDEVLAADWTQPSFNKKAAEILNNSNGDGSSSRGSDQSAQSPATPNKSPDKYEESNILGGDDFSMASHSKPVATPTDLIKVSGHVELVDGLAFVGGGQQLTLCQRVGGEIQQHGEVSILNGTFSIDIETPNKGLLVAELRTPEGALVGSGSLELASISNLKSPGTWCHHFKLGRI